MRRTLKLIAPIAVAALALPALAGGADCADHSAKAAVQAASAKGGCTASKEECAQYMAAARKNGWLGVEYDKTEAGVLAIKKVLPDSPAAKAGFQVGDVLVAMNGIEINDENKDKLKAVKKNLTPGASATYTIKRGSFSKDLTATLGTMPDAVYTAMVEEHMKEHVAVATK
jgi:S1-C subfamily serine protease